MRKKIFIFCIVNVAFVFSPSYGMWSWFNPLSYVSQSTTTKKEDHVWLKERLPQECYTTLEHWLKCSNELEEYREFLQHGGTGDIKEVTQKLQECEGEFDIEFLQQKLAKVMIKIFADHNDLKVHEHSLYSFVRPKSLNMHFSFKGSRSDLQQKNCSSSMTMAQIVQGFESAGMKELYATMTPEEQAAVDQEKKEKIEQFAGLYKFYIIPEDSKKTLSIVQAIIGLLISQSELQKCIHSLKIKTDLVQKDSGRGPEPMVIVYPSEGKAAANTLLLALAKVLKQFTGSSKEYTYSCYYTDLIRYSQGDFFSKWERPGNTHYNSEIKNYFCPKSDYALFKSDFMDKKEDYYLGCTSVKK